MSLKCASSLPPHVPKKKEEKRRRKGIKKKRAGGFSFVKITWLSIFLFLWEVFHVIDFSGFDGSRYSGKRKGGIWEKGKRGTCGGGKKKEYGLYMAVGRELETERTTIRVTKIDEKRHRA